jgi:membrane protein implicated in regulation of membrane protease activity
VRYSSLERGFQAGSPIASVLVIIVGSLAIAASIVVGLFAFVILGSLILVLAAALSVRLWWLRRKTVRDPASRVRSAERPDGVQQTIEGEYHVIVEEDEGRPR